MEQLNIDIKVIIASIDYKLWTWLALRDPELYEYSRKNAKTVVNLLTETITEGFVTSTLLFGRPHCTTRDQCGNMLPAVTWTDGSSKWYYNGELHSYDGQPALIVPRVVNNKRIEIKEWRRHGKLHRDELGRAPDCTDNVQRVLPAIDDGGYKYCWYRDGKLHRECLDSAGNTLPAICGLQTKWYKHGVLYKDIINGTYSPRIVDSLIESEELDIDPVGKFTRHYQNKQIHRDNDLPAYESTNVKIWYQHNLRHRDGDQPASVGNIEITWYWNGGCIDRYELCK